jgi:hypothetical protein
MRRSVLIATVLAGVLTAETRLGQPFTLSQSIPVSELMAKPEAREGNVVQVTGRITEVCEQMGCWMNLVDPKSNSRVRIKVNDGDLVFPKSAIGKMAVAEGKLTKIEYTREQAVAAARHEAEEQGRRFDPASIKSGKTVYQIAGTGALILDQVR